MDLAKGLRPWDAVIDATTHRLRPIVLTAAAASLGMIPIASEVFWGPMAWAIIGGLFVATLLTLLFLPALYVAWFRIKEPRKEPEPRLGAGVAAVGWARPAISLMARRSLSAWVKAVFPIVAQLESYRSDWLSRDVAAGLAIAAVALPVGVAYPAIAGLP